MDFIKKLFSAISLSLIISLPLTLLEAFLIFSLVDLYKIPYLLNFQYHQILGVCFIVMMTRNRIKIKDDKKESNTMLDIFNTSLNRLFRILFVWSVALCFHQIFLR